MSTKKIPVHVTWAVLPENNEACLRRAYHCKWRNVYFVLSQAQ